MILKWMDLPPLWLLAHLFVLWLGAPFDPAGIGSWGRVPGALLVLVGLALMVLAVREMARARTTVVPHMQPTALVTFGVFSKSRNPIYLGDALVLAGAALWLGAPLGLLLVPVFMRVITARFIAPEEARLKARFGAEFVAWSQRVPRWL